MLGYYKAPNLSPTLDSNSISPCDGCHTTPANFSFPLGRKSASPAIGCSHRTGEAPRTRKANQWLLSSRLRTGSLSPEGGRQIWTPSWSSFSPLRSCPSIRPSCWARRRVSPLRRSRGRSARRSRPESAPTGRRRDGRSLSASGSRRRVSLRCRSTRPRWPRANAS
jgi:hypothetical protein